MLTYHQEVYDLIYCRVDPPLLKGYYGGVLNDSRDRLFGATYVGELPDTDWELKSLKDRFGSYTILSLPPAHYTGEGRWVSAPPEPPDCRDYDGYCITFRGAWYREEWYILPELHFFRGLGEDAVKQRLYQPDTLSDALYLPTGSGGFRVPDILEPFGDAPQLAAYVMEKSKDKVNRAFVRYLCEGPLGVLCRRLRVRYPEAYNEMYGLFGAPFIPIFPEHKRFVLLVSGTRGRHQQKSTARYLLYDCCSHALFAWTYFPPTVDISWVSDVIDEQLQPLTNWNSQHIYTSRTLDDDAFWERYVFARENGEYKYLRRLDV